MLPQLNRIVADKETVLINDVHFPCAIFVMLKLSLKPCAIWVKLS